MKGVLPIILELLDPAGPRLAPNPKKVQG